MDDDGDSDVYLEDVVDGYHGMKSVFSLWICDVHTMLYVKKLKKYYFQGWHVPNVKVFGHILSAVPFGNSLTTYRYEVDDGTGKIICIYNHDWRLNSLTNQVIDKVVSANLVKNAGNQRQETGVKRLKVASYMAADVSNHTQVTVGRSCEAASNMATDVSDQRQATSCRVASNMATNASNHTGITRCKAASNMATGVSNYRPRDDDLGSSRPTDEAEASKRLLDFLSKSVVRRGAKVKSLIKQGDVFVFTGTVRNYTGERQIWATQLKRVTSLDEETGLILQYTELYKQYMKRAEKQMARINEIKKKTK